MNITETENSQTPTDRNPEKNIATTIATNVPESLSEQEISKSSESTETQQKKLQTHYSLEIGTEVFAKHNLLLDILEGQYPEPCLIVTNSGDCEAVEVLTKKRGFKIRRIVGPLTKPQAVQATKLINSKQIEILVANELTAKSLEALIEKLPFGTLINYSVPESSSVYLGRCQISNNIKTIFTFVSTREFLTFHNLTKGLEFKISNFVPTQADTSQKSLNRVINLLSDDKAKAKQEVGTWERSLAEGLIKNTSEESINSLAKMLTIALSSQFAQSGVAVPLNAELCPEKESDKPEVIQKMKEELKSSSELFSAQQQSANRQENTRTQSPYPEERGSREPNSRNTQQRSAQGRNEQQGEHPRGSNNHAPQEAHRHSSNPKPQHTEQRTFREHGLDKVRVYIGQGQEQGMDNETFLGLASEMAEVERNEISNIEFREVHGFADMTRQNARKLINSLNEIEYNSTALALEIANCIHFHESRNHHNDSSGGHRNSSRDQGGRYGNRNNDRRNDNRYNDNRNDDRRGGRNNNHSGGRRRDY